MVNRQVKTYPRRVAVRQYLDATAALKSGLAICDISACFLLAFVGQSFEEYYAPEDGQGQHNSE